MIREDAINFSLNCRDAGVCAGYINNWEIAGHYAKQSMIFAYKACHDIYSAQFHADYAFALWKQNLRAESLKEFALVLDRLQTLPDPKTNLRTLGLVKMLATTFIWITKNLNHIYKSTHNEHVEPYPGIFSQVEFNEQLKDLPFTPPISLWTLLADVEHEARLGDFVVKRLLKLEDKLPILYRSKLYETLISRHLYNGNLTSMMREINSNFALIKISKETKGNNEVLLQTSENQIIKFTPINTPIILTGLSLGLFGFIKNNDIKSLPLNIWEKEAEYLSINETVEWKEWYQLLISRENISSYDLHRIIMKTDNSTGLRILASILLLLRTDNPSYQLYASVYLFSTVIQFNFWQRDVEENLENLIIIRWELIIKEQSISLNSSAVAIPNIKNACDDKGKKGIQKVANIILVAQPATDLPLGNEMKDILIKASRTGDFILKT